VVAAWAAASLVGSYELLVWLIRTSGMVERGLSAEHLGNRAACRAATRSATTAAAGAGFPRQGERDTPDLARQPTAQAAGSAIAASGQRDRMVPEAGAVNGAAVAAYRLSIQAGNPAVGTQAGPHVRAHIAPLGARENRRRTAATVFGAHRRSGNLYRRPIPVVPGYGTLGDALSEFEP
jgi:hypothetical protein